MSARDRARDVVRIHEPSLGPDLWTRVSEPHVSHWLGADGEGRDYLVATASVLERRTFEHVLVERWLLQPGNVAPVAIAVAPDGAAAVVVWESSSTWGFEVVTLVGRSSGLRWGHGQTPRSGAGGDVFPSRPVFLPGGRRFLIAAGRPNWWKPTRARRVPGREPSGDLFIYDLASDELRSIELFAVPPSDADEKHGFDWRVERTRIAPVTITSDDEVSLTLQTGEVLALRVSDAWLGRLTQGLPRTLVRLADASGPSIVRRFDVPGGSEEATTRRIEFHPSGDFVAMTCEEPGRAPLEGVWSLETGAHIYSRGDGTLVRWINDVTAKNRASAKEGTLVLISLGARMLEVFELGGQSLMGRKRGDFGGTPCDLRSNAEGTVIAIAWIEPETSRGGVIVKKLYSPAEVMTDGGHVLASPTCGVLCGRVRSDVFAFVFARPLGSVPSHTDERLVVGDLLVAGLERWCTRPIYGRSPFDGSSGFELRDAGDDLVLRLSSSEKQSWPWTELNGAVDE